MINRFFFLFSASVFLIGNTASGMTSDSFTTHTQHTPIELKPISLKNSYKTASVCFLGVGDCGGGSFAKNDDLLDVDSVKQCKNEGFTTTDCSAPQVLTGECPYNSYYYQSCECLQTFKTPLDTCIANFQTGNETCESSTGIIYTDKCICNPNWIAEWQCADMGRPYPNPQYSGCWNALEAFYYVPECPHCDLSIYAYTADDVAANNGYIYGNNRGCQTDDGKWHYDSFSCNVTAFPQTYCEFGPENGTKICTDSKGNKRYEACRSTAPCPREGMNTPLDSCLAENKIGHNTCESDTGYIYADKCICGAPMIGEWICADMGRKIDNSLGCFNSNDAFYYFRSCQPCESKYKYTEQDCINKYSQPKNKFDYCIIGDEKSFVANPSSGIKKYTDCQCNPNWPADWECADMGRPYPNPEYGGCWNASDAFYYVPECPQCNLSVYKYTKAEIDEKNGYISGNNRACQSDDKIWHYDSYSCSKTTYPLNNCPNGAASGTKVCTDMDGKKHYQKCNEGAKTCANYMAPSGRPYGSSKLYYNCTKADPSLVGGLTNCYDCTPKTCSEIGSHFFFSNNVSATCKKSIATYGETQCYNKCLKNGSQPGSLTCDSSFEVPATSYTSDCGYTCYTCRNKECTDLGAQYKNYYGSLPSNCSLTGTTLNDIQCMYCPTSSTGELPKTCPSGMDGSASWCKSQGYIYQGICPNGTMTNTCPCTDMWMKC